MRAPSLDEPVSRINLLLITINMVTRRLGLGFITYTKVVKRRRLPMILRSVEAALGLYVLIAQAASVPAVDIEKTCRASEKALVDIFGSQTVATFENCM